jgi:beta-mannosidase
VRIEIEAEKGRTETEQIFGIRKIEIDKDWNWYLNNKRIFPRGTNVIPTQWLAEYTRKRINKDVELLKEANVNAVRVHAHITREEFYSRCDEEGILVWQDFALQWGYEDSDEFMAKACSQIEDMVNFLFNHPCIGVWCCHNEPSDTNREKLDFVLCQKVSSLDSTRYVNVASDFHFHPYPGWYYGHYSEFSGLPGKPFINEFGAQALPSLETLKEMFSSDELWPPKWEKWTYHDFQYDQTFNVAKIDEGKNIEEFIENSQNYQAKLLKYAIEHYRLAKFKEITGIFQFMFVDCWPSITWSVVDYKRILKKGYYALKQAYQPVLPVLKIGRETVLEGKGKFRASLYVINDTFRRYEGASIQVTMEREGELYFQFEKRMDIQSNCSQLIYAPSPLDSEWELTKPLIPGKYIVKLTLKDGEKKILGINEYSVEVAPSEFKG